MPSPVTTTRSGHIATVTLTGPGALNEMTAKTREALREALASVADDASVHAILIAAEGPAFATGAADLPGDGEPSVANAIGAMPMPTIAFIGGDCLDLGLEIAVACDVRYAGSAARFGIRQVQQGSLPWNGGTQRLARAVGRGHALRLLLTGEVIDAEEAARIGLIQRIGTYDDALGWAQRVAEGAPIAAAYTKEAATAGMDASLAYGLRLEADLSVLLQSTADREEGLASFRERRSPRFDGR